ncbi:MAG TPA: hypothetical protein VMH85_08195 [Terriglobales bacterium]|nr:hypothetical protein [Terriglobales bacterium]
MSRVETTAVPIAPAVPVNKIWRTIRGYILWSYERGTIQYDVMVTLILLFIFLSPVWINFRDKPIERTPHPTGVAVQPDANGGFIYQIDASAVHSKGDDAVRGELLGIIEPISGEVTINNVEAVRDHSGRVLVYRVWVHR